MGPNIERRSNMGKEQRERHDTPRCAEYMIKFSLRACKVTIEMHERMYVL